MADKSCERNFKCDVAGLKGNYLCLPGRLGINIKNMVPVKLLKLDYSGVLKKKLTEL